MDVLMEKYKSQEQKPTDFNYLNNCPSIFHNRTEDWAMHTSS